MKILNIIVIDKSCGLLVYKYKHKFGCNITESDILFYIERQGHNLSEINYYWSEDAIITFKNKGSDSVYYSGFDSMSDMIKYIKSDNVCLAKFKCEFGTDNVCINDLNPSEVDSFLCEYIK